MEKNYERTEKDAKSKKGAGLYYHGRVINDSTIIMINGETASLEDLSVDDVVIVLIDGDKVNSITSEMSGHDWMGTPEGEMPEGEIPEGENPEGVLPEKQ